MIGVREELREGVAKHRPRPLEGHAVPLEVGSRLERIPFERGPEHGAENGGTTVSLGSGRRLLIPPFVFGSAVRRPT